MKNHENRIDFESISVASRQIELALVIYLRQFYAQQIWLWFVRFQSGDSQKPKVKVVFVFCFLFSIVLVFGSSVWFLFFGLTFKVSGLPFQFLIFCYLMSGFYFMLFGFWF